MLYSGADLRVRQTPARPLVLPCVPWPTQFSNPDLRGWHRRVPSREMRLPYTEQPLLPAFADPCTQIHWRQACLQRLSKQSRFRLYLDTVVLCRSKTPGSGATALTPGGLRAGAGDRECLQLLQLATSRISDSYRPSLNMVGPRILAALLPLGSTISR